MNRPKGIINRLGDLCKDIINRQDRNEAADESLGAGPAYTLGTFSACKSLVATDYRN